MKQPSRHRGNGLHQAALDGSTRRTIALLSRSLIDINQRSEGWTPLMISAGEGHSGVVRILLDKGANVSIVSEKGSTALHLAARNGHSEVTTLLVKAGSDMKAQTPSSGHTPLLLAAQNGHVGVMKALVKAGADLEAHTSQGHTSLHLAAEQEHTEAMALLVSAGAHLEARSSKGFTPLHAAAHWQCSEAVALLIQAGAELKTCSPKGNTPLHLAAEVGNSETIRFLMEGGADLEATTPSGMTPLHKAATGGHTEGMEALIAAGANVDARMTGGDTPLLCAALKGHVGAVRVLLRSKANPLLGRTDRTPAETLGVPLDAAALNGHSEVVLELLQQLGIEGCGGESRGVDALSAAARSRYVNIMAILVGAGVVDTGAALCMAAKWGGEVSVKFLLRQQEARPIGGEVYTNAGDHVGATPLLNAIAANRCSARVVRMLIDVGADTTSAVRLTHPTGKKAFNYTPMGIVTHFLRKKKVGGQDVTEEQMNARKVIRRLLLQVEAVHAMSWLWPSDIPSAIIDTAKSAITSTSLRMTLPTLRRRAKRLGMVLAPLSRWVVT